MLEDMTPEMWAVVQLIITVQILFWFLTRAADFAMNLLTLRLLVGKIPSKREKWRSGKKKGQWHKTDPQYYLTKRGTRFLHAFMDGAMAHFRKSAQGALGSAVKNGKIPAIDADGNVSLTGMAQEFMGEKYGGLAGTVLQLWAKFRPNSFQAAMNKLMEEGPKQLN